MGLLRNVSSTFKYTRIEGCDPDEKTHREAQFLIYKTLKQADRLKRKPSWLIRFRISKLKVKIGRRLLRLKRTADLGFSKARATLCKQLSARFKLWGRLFQGGASIAAPQPAVVARLPQPLLA